MRQSKQLFRFTPARIAALMAVAVASFSGAAQAADHVGTDRAQYVASSHVIEKGHLQVETSLKVERDGSAMERSYGATTPTLLRFGVSKDVEVRIGTEGFSGHVDRSFITNRGHVTNGFGDASLGLKWHVSNQLGYVPAMAVVVDADIDSGSSEFRGNGVRPSVHVAAEWKLSHGLTLGVMPGLTNNKTADGRRFTSTSFGAVLGKAWTPKFSTFVEYSAQQLADRKYGGDVAYFNVGAAYQVAPKSYLDFSIQHGATSNAADASFAVGFTTKF